MEREDADRSLPGPVAGWVALGLRLGLVALVAAPALSKVRTYGRSVAFFDAIGLPLPAAMVVLAGLVELGAIASLVLGVGERVAALSLAATMLVAVAYVGPDWKNLAVLGGSLALVVLLTDTGAPRRATGRLRR